MIGICISYAEPSRIANFSRSSSSCQTITFQRNRTDASISLHMLWYCVICVHLLGCVPVCHQHIADYSVVKFKWQQSYYIYYITNTRDVHTVTVTETNKDYPIRAGK